MIWLIILLWCIGNTFLFGTVLKTIWFWFAVPIFSVKPLTMASALGLSLLISLFTFRIGDVKDNEDKDKAGENALKKCIIATVTYFIVLGMGYVYHLFM